MFMAIGPCRCGSESDHLNKVQIYLTVNGYDKNKEVKARDNHLLRFIPFAYRVVFLGRKPREIGK